MRVTHPYRWALGVVVAVVAALVVGVEVAHPSAEPQTSTVTFNGTVQGAGLIPADQRQPVPDFTGIAQWIDSPPLHERALRGSVVLVDFWTFSCVNCTRTIPHLRALDDTYRARGLVLVGVHSPEFDFEKDPANVRAAVRRLGVTWPVALDSSMATWNAFGNEYWPAEYLVDRQGRVAYVHAGEGDYGATEQAVVALLGAGATPAAAASTTEAVPGQDTTPELYAGSARGRLGDQQAYGGRGQVVDYPDHGAPTAADRITVAGAWSDAGEYLQAAGAGHVRLRFHAHDLYVVGGSAGGGPIHLSVSLDGAPVPAGRRGPDLGAAGVTVRTSDLLHLLTALDGGEHVIDIVVPAGFRLYTFTFG